MQIHNNLHSLPPFKNAVVTVGSFDGVHLGHQKILTQLQEEALEIGGDSVLVTFHPHPRLLLKTLDATPVSLLNTWEEKQKLLAANKLDHLVVVEFNTAFSALEPEEYITDFLVAKIKPASIIIGYDHKFGKGRKGDIRLLKELANKHNYTVQEISEEVLNDVTISSTKIRKALHEGDVTHAAQLLGYNYSLTGTVVKGKQLGRTIGYPTANITVEDAHKLIPADGVYAVKLTITKLKQAFSGMMNIGNRPTVNGENRTIEVNIFDFDEDIYNQKIEIALVEKIRDEVKFEGIDALKQQLAIDEIKARQILSSS